ncbi:MAG: PHP domain-containing protein [Deltaproteobacteria bacterium]|nr:PHP domain-containing protein [Deltaproteobacteria bacterium]
MERGLARFRRMLREGRYLFHFHTSLTDGYASLQDYCEAAKELGFKYVTLMEHVRRVNSYDFSALVREVARVRERFRPMEIFLGVEAKVLPGGLLDVSDEVLAKVDVLGIANHSFPLEAHPVPEATASAFERYRARGIARVWLHPGLHLLDATESSLHLVEGLLALALERGVFVEFNLRYGLPPEELRTPVPASRVVLGVDAHSIADVEASAAALLSAKNCFA